MRVFIFSLISFIGGIVLTVLFLWSIEMLHKHQIDTFYDAETKRFGFKVRLDEEDGVICGCVGSGN